MEKKVELYVCILDHITHSMDEYKVGDWKWLSPSQITISRVRPCWRKATCEEVRMLLDGKESEMRKAVSDKTAKKDDPQAKRNMR